VTSHDNHSWERLPSSVSKATLAWDILAFLGLEHHVRRDFSVSGVKACDQNGHSCRCDIPDFRRHSFAFLETPENRDLNESEEILQQFISDMLLLLEWKNSRKDQFKPYNPGPQASDSCLSRIMAFGPRSEQGEMFKWTKRKKVTGIRMRDDIQMPDDISAMQIKCSGSDLADLDSMLKQRNDEGEEDGMESDEDDWQC
jgi:hypothetical protein